MIVVIEGISAVGKTTFSRQFGAAHWVPEFETISSPPPAAAPAQEKAEFWLEHNVRRFQAALDVECSHGFAICDTEPLKTHFNWCLARAGLDTMDEFQCAVPLVREAIAGKRLGFGDRYYVKHLPPSAVRAQKEGDPTRSRRNFDRHLALQPHLLDWFSALSEALPGRVEFQLPDFQQLKDELQTRTPEASPRRFDVLVFDQLVENLPR